MATDFRELRRDISSFLLALRRSIDRPFRPLSTKLENQRDRFTRLMLLVEEARIRFDTYYRYSADPTPEEWAEARDALLKFSMDFMHSPDADPSLFERPFRVLLSSAQRANPSEFVTHLLKNSANVGDAILAFERYVSASIITGPLATDYQPSFDLDSLERIVPQQQVAPARFSIENNRIHVLNLPPEKNSEDLSNISSACEHILDEGAGLIESLERSNCDKRLQDKVKRLQEQIAADENIVKIGMSNIACGFMASEFEHELPNAINAMLSAYSTSISMYVSQFPEWENFANKAASVNLSEDDVLDIYDTADEIISHLEVDDNLASPEVPKTIKLVRELMESPGRSSKRAAFAMMRTIENLVSSIVRYSLAVISQTAEKTVGALSTVVSKVLAALLGVALVGAAGIGSSALSAGSPWVKQAAEIVKRQMESLPMD